MAEQICPSCLTKSKVYHRVNRLRYPLEWRCGKCGNQWTTRTDYEREDYDKAIELDPNDVFVYTNRGKAYEGLGQYQRAIADYDKVIELEPDGLHTFGAHYRRQKAFRSLDESKGNAPY